MQTTKKAPYAPGDSVLAMHCGTPNGGTVLEGGTVLACVARDPHSNTNREWRLSVKFHSGVERDFTIRGRESDYVLPA